MFEQSRLMFLYCVTPAHMGAGQAIGVIDNPIQRERHTNHPSMAGSGIKGALRHHVASREDKSLVSRLFGPENSAPDHAGAVGFSDGQLLAFPVRSLKQAFVYAVSPTTLARLKRLAQLTGLDADWGVPAIQDNQATVCGERILNGGRLVLEAFEYQASVSDDLKKIALWIASNALPRDEAHGYFRDKIAEDLVLIPEDALSHFVENATVVEPHVRINDETGTAAEGGLFYTENLPPETVLIAPVFSSVERSKRGEAMSVDDVMQQLVSSIQDQLVQFGADATTGRGQVVLHIAGEGRS
jgi:CRISPR-associated protein Cmr4